MERCLVATLICITLGGCKIYTRTEGQGLILSPDNNFFCQNNSVDCVQEYDSPRIQTLNALPAPDYTFARWNGCTYTAPNTCQTSITQDAIDADAEWTVTATFEPRLITPREATYTYNANGQRITKTVDGVTTLFQYDMEGNLLAELDVSGKPIKQHVYINGEPIAVINQNPVQDKRDIYYVHTDHLGTPSLITSSNATIVADYDSTPFGEVQTHYDEIDYNKRFPGQYRDDESGLHYNQFRDYEPTLGRYIQSDPIGQSGGLNTYVYTVNNPVLYSDALGLHPSLLPEMMSGEIPSGGYRMTMGVFGCGIGCASFMNTDTETQLSMEATLGGGVTVCFSPKDSLRTDDSQPSCDDEPKDCGMYDPNCDNELLSPSLSPPGKLGVLVSASLGKNGGYCMNFGPHTGLPLPGVSLGGTRE